MFHERGIPRAEATNGMTESFEHCSPANFGWECSLSMMDMGLKNMLFFISLGSTNSYYTYRKLNLLKTWRLCWPRINKHRILLLQLIGRVYLSWVDMGRGDASQHCSSWRVHVFSEIAQEMVRPTIFIILVELSMTHVEISGRIWGFPKMGVPPNHQF